MFALGEYGKSMSELNCKSNNVIRQAFYLQIDLFYKISIGAKVIAKVIIICLYIFFTLIPALHVHR